MDTNLTCYVRHMFIHFRCFLVLFIAGGHILGCRKLKWEINENLTNLAFKTPVPLSKLQVEDSQCQ